MEGLAWDDLRFVRAVADAGSVRRGALQLRVSHQTVTRHIAALEASLGTKLFIRSAAGYLLTPAAEELVRTAESVDALIGSAARRLMAKDIRPAGTVRVALIDWIIPTLCPDFAEFGLQYPEIELEIVGGTAMASFSKREADLAVRLARAPGGDLVGRKVATSRAAIYASRGYLKRVARRKPLEQHHWIGLAEPWRNLRPGAWMNEHVPKARVVARTGTPHAMLSLIRAGAGIGLQPCLVGDAEPDLVRVRAKVIDALDVPVWVLTHPDLQRTARVRVLMDFLVAALSRRRAGFEGRGRRSRGRA